MDPYREGRKEAKRQAALLKQRLGRNIELNEFELVGQGEGGGHNPLFAGMLVVVVAVVSGRDSQGVSSSPILNPSLLAVVAYGVCVVFEVDVPLLLLLLPPPPPPPPLLLLLLRLRLLLLRVCPPAACVKCVEPCQH